MYGLLSSMMSSYRIRNDTKENYNTKKLINNKSSITAGQLVEIIFSIITLLVLVDVWIVRPLNSWILVAILVLFSLPGIGDVTALLLIAYWFSQVRNSSFILANFRI